MRVNINHTQPVAAQRFRERRIVTYEHRRQPFLRAGARKLFLLLSIQVVRFLSKKRKKPHTLLGSPLTNYQHGTEGLVGVTGARGGKVENEQKRNRKLMSLKCPHCRHETETDLPKPTIWRSRFRCGGCGGIVNGRQFWEKNAHGQLTAN